MQTQFNSTTTTSSKMTQRLLKTVFFFTKTKHYNLHECKIYCRAFVLFLSRFLKQATEYCYILKTHSPSLLSGDPLDSHQGPLGVPQTAVWESLVRFVSSWSFLQQFFLLFLPSWNVIVSLQHLDPGVLWWNAGL